MLRDGTPVPGDGGGGVTLFAELRLTRPLARVLKALHAAPLLDALDKVVAGQRSRLARFVREGEAPRRYP